MFKIALNKIFVVFVGAIVGFITGFAAATLAGFVLNTILGGIYYSYQATFTELLGRSAIEFGTYGAIGGFITGVGVALMGVRPYGNLIWPLILGVGMVLGGLIGKGDRVVQYVMDGYWYPPFYITIIIAIVTWSIVYLIERMLGKQLSRGRITSWIISGYFVAIVFIAFATYRLLRFFALYIFH